MNIELKSSGMLILQENPYRSKRPLLKWFIDSEKGIL